jgi:site-specific recombinase XerD
LKGARQLTDEEIRKVAQRFNGRYAIRNRALFVLGLACGGRISELLSLNIGDIWQHGKPVDIIYFKKANTKGKRQGRGVPIKQAAKEAIFELITWYHKKRDAVTDDMPLFLSQKGGRITRQQAHDILKDAFKESQLLGKVSTHSLRKTYANKLLKQGGNLHTVKEALGHTSIATTQEYLGIDFDEFFSATPDYDFKSYETYELSDLDNTKIIAALEQRIAAVEQELQFNTTSDKIITFAQKRQKR